MKQFVIERAPGRVVELSVSDGQVDLVVNISDRLDEVDRFLPTAALIDKSLGEDGRHGGKWTSDTPCPDVHLRIHIGTDPAPFVAADSCVVAGKPQVRFYKQDSKHHTLTIGVRSSWTDEQVQRLRSLVTEEADVKITLAEAQLDLTADTGTLEQAAAEDKPRRKEKGAAIPKRSKKEALAKAAEAIAGVANGTLGNEPGEQTEIATA